jgi:dTDP-4-dehydrorhamnose 3,5-epimerase
VSPVGRRAFQSLRNGGQTPSEFAPAMMPNASQKLSMQITSTAIADVLLMKPKVFRDSCGLFFESLNLNSFKEAIGTNSRCVQDNYSHSAKGVPRGPHHQIQQPLRKLVHVTRVVLDDGGDIRRRSATFRLWVAGEFSSKNGRQMWIEPCFTFGFLKHSDYADFLYKTNDYHGPQNEECFVWNDVDIGTAWIANLIPKLLSKNQAGVLLSQAEVF